MIPAITAVRLTGARHRAELPLLVLGPSLGTSATTLWSACAAHLTDAFDVVAWDLPGHGHNRSVPEEPFTMAELAAGVLEVVDTLLAERGQTGGSFAYAGDSVGGAVGLQLMLDVPDRVESAVLLCTGARIGDPDMWADRIGQVSTSGTPAMVSASTERWFGPGFLDREPERGSALLHALQEADDAGYCQVCGVLAGFDVRDRLAEIGAPVLAVAGAADVATPTERLREIAEGVKDGQLVELDGRGPPRSGRGARDRRPVDPAPRPRRGGATPHDVRRRHGGAPRGPRRRPRRPGGRGDHRLHPRLPGAHHQLRLGHDLDPSRARPAQPVPDHPHRAGRTVATTRSSRCTCAPPAPTG